MIEYQQRYPEFPGEPWEEFSESGWQIISLKDIKQFRFRFHGKVIETRKCLNECLEKEIIEYRLRGKVVDSRMLDGSYKK